MISTAEDVLDSNVALTTVVADTATWQAPVPPHAPVQPVNVEPVAAVAVRVMAVPLAIGSEQSLPQAMPGPVTVPVPVPAFTTVSVEVLASWVVVVCGALVAFEVVLVAVPVSVAGCVAAARAVSDELLLALAVALTATFISAWISLADSARL
jgi:hypothetical protein